MSSSSKCCRRGRFNPLATEHMTLKVSRFDQRSALHARGQSFARAALVAAALSGGAGLQACGASSAGSGASGAARSAASEAEAAPALEGAETKDPLAVSSQDSMDFEAEFARLEAAREDAGKSSETAGASSDAVGASGGAGSNVREGWSVTYRVAPSGLQVEVVGLRLRPRATIARVGSRYRIKLAVEVESVDGEQYILSGSGAGPLSIAGEIVQKNGTLQAFADQRVTGGGDVAIGEHSVQLDVAWPLKGQPSLERGEKLHLDVGLWGVALPGQRARPLRRLFRVEAAGEGKGAVSVTHPPEDWGAPGENARPAP
jgi:hypothetical protein